MNEEPMPHPLGDRGRDRSRQTGVWKMHELPEIPVRRPTGKARGPGHDAPRIVCSALPWSETRTATIPIRLIGAFAPGL
jgi:hypothetical protein